MSLRRFMNLVEDAPIEGMLPAPALAAMLPDVANAQIFGTALLKIEQGQSATLILSEIRELANAFISLVQLPDKDKMQVIVKMTPVHQNIKPSQ